MPLDPKYDFPGGVYHRLGNYLLPDDEPVILFRGKDEGTLAAIKGYLDFLQAQTPSEIRDSHIETASERLVAIGVWQVEHPQRTGMGCHLRGCNRIHVGACDVEG